MVQSTAVLTKSLRDRSKALLDLLPVARESHANNVSIYFPGKEEWLVEWLVERLSNEKTSEGGLSSDVWDFLHQLLASPNLNIYSASTTLNKHGFIEILDKTLANAVSRYSDENRLAGIGSIEDGTRDQDTDMQDTISSASSSTEPGSPLLKIASLRGVQPRALRAYIQRSHQIQQLLGSIFRVTEFLETRFRRPLQPEDRLVKRRRLFAAPPILKASPDVASSILSSYLSLLYLMCKSTGVPNAALAWNSSCHSIWKACTYGIPDMPKVFSDLALSSLVSEKILPPLAMLLSLNLADSSMVDLASWFLRNYIFRRTSHLKDKQNELFQLLRPISEIESSGRDFSSSFPSILRLAIDDNPTKQRHQIDGFLSLLASWMLTNTTTYAIDISTEILEIIVLHRIAIDEKILTLVLNRALKSLSSIPWRILESVAKMDLDVVLNLLDEALFTELVDLEAAEDEAQIWGFLKQFIARSVDNRDFQRFLKTWARFLAQSNNQDVGVWYSDRFQRLVSAYVESGFTGNQIKEYLKAELSDEPKEFPKIVVIDALLGGLSRIETIEQLDADGLSLSLLDLAFDGATNQPPERRWRYIRVLTRILNLWPSLAHSTQVLELKRQALQHKSNKCSRKEFSLLTSMVLLSRGTQQNSLNEMETILKDISDSFSSECEPDLISLIYAILECFPEVLSMLGESAQQEFLIAFVCAASRISKRTDSTSLRSVWSAFIRHGSSMYDNMKLKDSFIATLISILRSDPLNYATLPLALEALEAMPLNVLRKSQRDGLVDATFSVFRASSSDQLRSLCLAVLLRLSQFPTNSTLLVSSIGSKDGLFSVISPNRHAGSRKELKLISLTLRHLLASIHHSKSEEYLVSAVVLAVKTLGDKGITEWQRRAWALATARGILSPQTHGADKIMIHLSTLRDAYFQLLAREGGLIVRGDMRKESDIESSSWNIALLDALEEGTKSGVEEAPLEAIIGDLSVPFSEFSSKGGVLASTVREWLVNYGRIACQARADGGKVATAVVATLVNLGLHNQLSDSYTSMARTLTTNQLVSLIEMLTEAYFTDSPDMSASYLLVLSDLIKVATATTTDIYEYGDRFGRIHTKLIQTISSCTHFASLLIQLDITAMLAKQKTIPLSQVHIEEMFASLSALTSVFGPSIDHDFENTDVIFLPLCSIVANILSVQRYRAKGRYSILFATLQGLMNLLFLPKVIGRRKIDSEIYPPWLRERKVWTVSKEAGLYYCRLLTMLCDPTTSSVRMNRKTDQLSSATAAARKAVEPHVPVLLKHYIGLSLTHSLPQEVRSAITPGLYAMFDVMQPSTLRSLNLSLDNPGRVLFKSLYEDWSKFGKWKE